MMALLSSSLVTFPRKLASFSHHRTHKDKPNACRFTAKAEPTRPCRRRDSEAATSSPCSPGAYGHSKKVWIWTESKEVVTSAVERGWNTFVFSAQSRKISGEWSPIAVISCLYVEEERIFDDENRRVGSVHKVSNPGELELLQQANGFAENVVVDLLDWQVIPAENLVAAFQRSQKTIFAISRSFF